MRKKIKILLKLRKKLGKIEHKWDEFRAAANASGVDPIETCDAECTEECFSNDTWSKYSPLQTMIRCVVSQC